MAKDLFTFSLFAIGVLFLVAVFIAVVVLIVMAINKKNLKGIITTSVSLAVASLLTFTGGYLLLDKKEDPYKSDYSGVEVDGLSEKEIDEIIENALESEPEDTFDKNEYTELDVKKLRNREYPKQTHLKITGGTVEGTKEITPGELLTVTKDGHPITVHNVTKEASIGNTYDFYGVPDEDGRLILLEIE